MPINYTVEVNGVLPETSLRAFKDGYNKTSKMSYFQSNKEEIEDYFLSALEENMKYLSTDIDGLKDSFSINIENDRIEFLTTKPNLVNKIEYGYDGFVGERFMEPSVLDVGKFMSNKMINEATSYYSKNTPITHRIEGMYSGGFSLNTNKYGYMLK